MNVVKTGHAQFVPEHDLQAHNSFKHEDIEESDYLEREITPWQEKYHDEDFDYGAWEKHLILKEKYASMGL